MQLWSWASWRLQLTTAGRVRWKWAQVKEVKTNSEATPISEPCVSDLAGNFAWIILNLLHAKWGWKQNRTVCVRVSTVAHGTEHVCLSVHCLSALGWQPQRPRQSALSKCIPVGGMIGGCRTVGARQTLGDFMDSTHSHEQLGLT